MGFFNVKNNVVLVYNIVFKLFWILLRNKLKDLNKKNSQNDV